MRFVNVILITALAGALVSRPVTVRAQTPPPTEKLYAPAEVRSDAEVMYRRLQADAFNLYAFTPKAELDRSYERLRDGIDRPLTHFEVETQLETFLSVAHQGHTRVEGVYGAWREYQNAGGRAFPLTIRIVDGRVYVAKNLSGVARLKPGDEILAIDGEPMARWLDRTRRHISAETTNLADSILEYDFPMYLWVEVGSRPNFHVSVKSTNNGVPELEVPARTAREMASMAAGQPKALDLEHPLRTARILTDGSAYLRPGPFYNEEAKSDADQWDVTAFRAFIDSAFRMFNTKGARRLIIDLRGNPGGDSLFSDVMVSWIADRPYQFFSSFHVRVSDDAVAANRNRIEHDAAAAGPISQRFAALYAKSRPGDVVDFSLPPSLPNQKERFRGKVFVLIDRQAYSNAVAVAATIQDYKFGKVLGEPTADMATAFGAMEQFSLPATGIVVGFPKAHIVRPNGDARPKGVTPDMAIRFPTVETPEDEVLRRAATIAAASHGP